MNNAIYEGLKELVGEMNVKQNEPMKNHTSFKVGGNADYFVQINSADELEDIANFAKVNNIKLYVIGNGTNIIVTDKGIRGIVVKYIAKNIKIEGVSRAVKANEDTNINVKASTSVKANEDTNINVKASKSAKANEDANVNAKTSASVKVNACVSANNCVSENVSISVDAGVSNAYLAQVLLNNEITGFEFASGIPGTIGGAIAMNAGCYQKEFKDIVQEVTFIDLDEIKLYTISHKNCAFAYRSSIFLKKNCIIINAVLKLSKGVKEDIKRQMDEYREKRVSSQPLEYPNAGSTFKRGSDFVTAKLIDEAGLKGYSIGGAEVSKKHAGFIINKGNATATDIIDLIKYIKKKIFEEYNINIEEEVRIIGE